MPLPRRGPSRLRFWLPPPKAEHTAKTAAGAARSASESVLFVVDMLTLASPVLVDALCSGLCSKDPAAGCGTNRCRDCAFCSPPPPPPLPPISPDWWAALPRPQGEAHDYGEALRLALFFYRTQRSGDLRDDPLTPAWRRAPSFATDGADVGVDLSRGYFDAGDFVKFGQPAAYTMTMLAWSGVEFEAGLHSAGALVELLAAVRWGADYILAAATNLEQRCTFYAQVGRGAQDGCTEPRCKFDHGYWGRPEEYEGYAYAWQRRTWTIDADTPGTEIWAGASAALAAAHLLLRRHSPRDEPYLASLLRVSKALYACAVAHNPQWQRLQATRTHRPDIQSPPSNLPSPRWLSSRARQATLYAVAPQYRSYGCADELGWAAAWLSDATGDAGYAAAFRANMHKGENRWGSAQPSPRPAP